MKFLASAIAVILLTASVSQAKNLVCRGINESGQDVTFAIFANFQSDQKVITYVDQDHENEWIADQVAQRNKGPNVQIMGSYGSRAEYFFDLVLTAKINGKYQGTLNYVEDDSGWEYRSRVSNIVCE